MDAFAVIAAALVVAWAALVIVAQRLNPEQSPLSMGMSGLARGHAPWVMKSAFLCRGASALMLLIALPSVLGTAGLTLAGILAFWVWGVGSAALAVVDTDMPGEPHSQTGAVHAAVALAAYVCGVAGAVVISVVLLRTDATGGIAIWALPLALTAAAAMGVQLAAFAAAARAARPASDAGAASPAAAAPSAAPASPAAAPSPAVAPSPAAAPAAAAVTAPVLPHLAVPPQLSSGGRIPPVPPAASRQTRPPATGRPGRPAFALDDLGAYAGLFQRIFLGLLMAWTLLVAGGVVRL